MDPCKCIHYYSIAVNIYLDTPLPPPPPTNSNMFSISVSLFYVCVTATEGQIPQQTGRIFKKSLSLGLLLPKNVCHE